LLPDVFNVYLSTPRSVAAEMYGFGEQLRIAVHELTELLASS
jgi:carnitine O-acetyltransferase